MPGFRLQVAFRDGTQGEVHLADFLERREVEGTVFESLRDATKFSAVRVTMGAVEWPSGADLAPDAMYDAIRKTGRFVVE